MAHLNLSRIEDRFPTIYITLISVLLAVELAFSPVCHDSTYFVGGQLLQILEKSNERGLGVPREGLSNEH